MKAKPSECKLDTSCNWNNFHISYANTLKNDPRIKFVDLNSPAHCKNEPDTAMIEVTFERMFEAMNFAAEWSGCTDEFHIIQKTSNSFYIRLWWD